MILICLLHIVQREVTQACMYSISGSWSVCLKWEYNVILDNMLFVRVLGGPPQVQTGLGCFDMWPCSAYDAQKHWSGWIQLDATVLNSNSRHFANGDKSPASRNYKAIHMTNPFWVKRECTMLWNSLANQQLIIWNRKTTHVNRSAQCQWGLLLLNVILSQNYKKKVLHHWFIDWDHQNLFLMSSSLRDDIKVVMLV